MLAILLSTYNGERFLREQLDSLFNQRYSDFTLYVRDDGSTDTTVDIIHEYQTKHENVILLHDPWQHRGASGSFMWMLQQIEADFYMFCDQDDVWMSNKVGDTFSLMQQCDLKQPTIIHTDLAITDENLHVTHPSYWSFTKKPAKYSASYHYHCAYNNVTGCTMLINRQARDLAVHIPENSPMHDKWIALVVSYHRGTIRYLPYATIYYRQHATNVIGAKKSDSYLRKLQSLRELLRKNGQWYRTVKELTNISLPYFILNKLRFALLRALTK
ncbi:glycosyltransferase family 2 protein [Alistipes indistinctus]|jgi:glycosyltransferase involved in cell wall biosynthesis|uniref:glycosyltransferase family 2 protein n=1 Tax=Alistipes indistinctus TaxID=626932 RepID=UPI0024326F53|nr:glycosyltransferase family 2 protein [Alistipes indistinctus]